MSIQIIRSVSLPILMVASLAAHAGAPVCSKVLGATVNEHHDPNVPENQPDNRFRGQAPIPERPADQPPLWRTSDFHKMGVIMGANPKIEWMSKDVFNPSAVVGEDGRVYLFFRAEDHSGMGQWNGTSRVGLAVSDDGIHFRPVKDDQGEDLLKPILEPTESFEKPGGTEDPRVVEFESPIVDENGKTWRYGMTYTAFDGKMARLAMAVSADRIHWTKRGLMFTDAEVLKNPVVPGSPWTKSGAIVPRKINGQYVMYFGEGRILMATSQDGLHWDYPQDPTPVFATRHGYFDQGLVEAGPTPWVDDDGIHLLYHGDGPPHGYQVGEIVFDLKDPKKILRRSSSPFLSPDQPFEKTGQVGAVVFASGMVFFKGQIFLYYGAADGKIALAIRAKP